MIYYTNVDLVNDNVDVHTKLVLIDLFVFKIMSKTQF